MSSSFPLLNLPPKAITHVLKSMEFKDFITLSFFSRRAKRAVESMGLVNKFVGVFLSEVVSIQTPINNGSNFNWKFYGEQLEKKPDILPLPDRVELSIRYGESWRKIWSMEGLSIKEWIAHFGPIFNFSKQRTLHFWDSSTKFDINELRNTFDSNWDLYIAEIGESTNYFESLITNFPARSLRLDDSVFATLNHPQLALIQNYDGLEIQADVPTPSTLELDDLLMVNSKYIKVTDLTWKVKDFNRFIKHWIKGSNPRMEMLTIDFDTLRDPEIPDFLKGIRYTEVPEDETRWFENHHNGRSIQVDGGFDFYRQDGTKATIAYIPNEYDEDDDEDGIKWIAMFVWHPHCDSDY